MYGVVCISHRFGKDMNLTILPPTMVGSRANFGIATTLGEGKL